MVESVETIGAPEFFIDHIECEVAAVGIVRVYGIAVRAGVQFVAYSTVMTAEAAVMAGRLVTEAAQASVAVTVSH